MMKNLPLALNVVLLAAVGFLYYNNFSAKKSPVSGPNNNNKNAVTDSNCNKAHIAYVELDSMYENISYIKQKREDMEAKQKRIENEWQSGMSGLKARQENFMKKGAAITQQEAEQFQNQLLGEQQQIESNKQRQAQALSEENFKFTEKLQKDLKGFLETYNKEKKYMYILATGTGLDYLVYKDSALNITNDVIKGMNNLINTKTP
ncbi:MAG: OmpH family outer membrane protein [Chitinophagaceae bacterium]|nr:OmpH family outer membrane protein [Chitinophagaceae bacterium]